MKLFVLSLQSWSEEEFGDLGMGPKTILGVFSSQVLAEQAGETVKRRTIHAQYGSEIEHININECDLDEVNLISDYNSRMENYAKLLNDLKF